MSVDEQNETNLLRDAMKKLPSLKGRDNWRGDDGDSMVAKGNAPICRFCGEKMHVHRDWGKICMWACDGMFPNNVPCPNNINEKQMVGLHSVDTVMPNNKARIFNDWEPRRLI